MSSSPNLRQYRIGRSVQLTVDTSQGGTGPLLAEAKGVFTGTTPKITITMLEGYNHLVKMTPSLPDEYKLAVHWSGQPVEGSPFLIKFLEASEPHRVNVQGLAGRMFSVDQPVLFDISAKDAGHGEIVVRASGPTRGNQQSRVSLDDNGDGTFRGQYIPTAAGNHEIVVTWDGTSVPGSPFTVRVFDTGASAAARVSIHGPEILGRVFQVGKPVELLIDTSLAGPGKITSSATSQRSGSELKTELFQTGPNTYLLRINSNEADVYQLAVFYEGTDIPKSPLLVNFSKPPDPTACVVRDIRSGSLLVNEQLVFTVDSADAGSGDLVVRASGPTKGGPAQLEIVDNNDESYSVKYTPNAPGIHKFHILWGTSAIPGSPFEVEIKSRAQSSNASMCIVQGTSLQGAGTFSIGDVCSFTVETSNAGLGHLNVKAGGPIQDSSEVQVEDHGNGKYTIFLRPTMPGEFRLDVLWAGSPVPRSPFVFQFGNVINPNVCKAEGPGLRKAHVGEVSSFRVYTAGAGTSELTVSAIGERSDADVAVTKVATDAYDVKYMPSTPGAYLLNVRWDGRHVPGSPFKISVSHRNPASICRLAGDAIHDGIVGQPIEFVVHTKEAGYGTMAVKAYGIDGKIDGYVVDEDDGRLTARFDPPKHGKYKIGIYWDRRHIPGSPFLVVVRSPPDTSKVRAEGPGLQNGRVGDPGTFTIQTEDAGTGHLDVRVVGPKGGFKADLRRDSESVFVAQYNPSVAGKYEIEIDFAEQPIPGTPFIVEINE
eukprot:m.22748 g.22748  ORF g.22748 m.22748 type:complete len:766 (+) comp28394_c0_seq1:137-2434(+)